MLDIYLQILHLKKELNIKSYYNHNEKYWDFHLDEKEIVKNLTKSLDLGKGEKI